MSKKLPKHFESAKERSGPAGKHLALSGWAGGTLSGYSSGMSKFAEFKMKTRGYFDEDTPISDEDIYDFIAWAGESKAEKTNGPDKVIASVTIKKYLDGIRAWHMVKHLAKPSADRDVVSTLLNATKRNEEEKELVTVKQPIMIRQLFKLIKETTGKTDELQLVGSVALIAFWGMARLGELMRQSREEGAILRSHVEFGEKGGKRFAKIHLRKAKSAKPGEVQTIHLQQQMNVLDPVSALERVLRLNEGGDRDDLLFASHSPKGLTTMKKPRFIKLVEQSWGKAGVEKWSGHSFRVGGASIRYNLGTPVKTIAKQGRWKSLAYLRYFKA